MLSPALPCRVRLARVAQLTGKYLYKTKLLPAYVTAQAKRECHGEGGPLQVSPPPLCLRDRWATSKGLHGPPLTRDLGGVQSTALQCPPFKHNRP